MFGEEDSVQDSTAADNPATYAVSPETTNDQPADESPAQDSPAQNPDPGDAPAADPEGDKVDADEIKDGAVDAKGQPTRYGLVKKILGLGPKEDKKPDAKKPDDKAAKPEGDDTAAKPGDPQPGDAKDEVPAEIAASPHYQKLKSENDRNSDLAQRFVTMTSHLQKSGVTPQETSRSLQLAVLAKTDPEKFYDAITEIRDEYGIMLGKGLPADLQKAVEDGLMTEDYAKEYAKLRVGKKHAEATAESAVASAENTTASTLAAQRRNIVHAFFEKTGKTDLDLAKKVPLIQAEIFRLKAAHGDPADGAAELMLLQVAYQNVNKSISGFMPSGHKKPVNPPPRSNTAPAQAQAPAKANTRLDLVQQVFQRNGQ